MFFTAARNKETTPVTTVQSEVTVDYHAIAEHVRARMQTAKVIKSPFPQIFVEHLLPEDYYDFLIDALPLPQDVGSNNHGALNFGVTPRDGVFAKLSPWRQAIWLDFERHINQPIIRWELIRLLTPYLEKKCEMTLDKEWKTRAEHSLGPEWRQLFASGEGIYQPENSSGGRILLVSKDFHLPPHIDNATSILTALFYMPRDNSHEHAGTRLYRVKNENHICSMYSALKRINVWYPPEKELKAGSTMFPFRRNSLAAMVCLPTAVHSVELSGLDFCRYAMQTQILLRDDLTKELFAGWELKAGGY